MWNDGYSKEQPWLNYFNSYERMHCCFDGDGGDDSGDSGSDDDITSGGTGTGTGSGSGTGTGTGTGSGTGSGTGVGTGGPDVEDDVVDVAPEGFSIGTGTGSGTGTGGTGDVGAADDEAANTSGAAFAASYNTGAGKGASDAEDSGMTADQAAAVAAAMDAAAAVTGTSVEGQQAAGDVVAADQQGIDISQVDSGLSKADPSLTDIETLESLGIIGYNDKVSLGYFEKAAAEDYARSKAEAAALQASYRAKGKDVTISVDKDGLYSYTGKDAFSVGYSEMGKGAELLGQNFGIGSVVDGLNRAFGTTEEEVASSYGQGDPGANFSDFQSTSSQNGDEDGEDETFGEDETDEGVDDTDTDTDTETSTTESEEEEAAPETAMEAYFRKLGIASPALTVSSTSPSYFQGYPSYLPPTGPAANAAYRRKLALRTPRYQEPSGTNPSIATYAAAYGIPYTEAAKKFAPPSVPAMGGGGLRSLMEYK